MKNLLRFVGLAVLLQAGVAFGQTTVVDSIMNQGLWRSFRVYLPAKYHKPSVRPVILHLHGYSSNGQVEQAFTNYMPIADTANFLVVYPDGAVDSFGKRGWNVGWPGIGNAAVDDIKFLSALIDTLHARYTIDLTRVYASGLSLGGYMCYQLAWKLSDRIAAIASVSGSMYPSVFAKCAPPRPIPVMEIHGTTDNIIPYNGSAGSVNIDTLINFWVRNDHCIPLASETTIPIAPADGTSVMHFVWDAEVSSVSCELYRIIGGGHVDWPAAAASGEFGASKEIWRFFNRYTVGQFASVASRSAAQQAPMLYPNPCTDIVHFDGGGTLSFFDPLGRSVMTSQSRELDLRGLPAGMYLVRAEHAGAVRTQKLLKQ